MSSGDLEEVDPTPAFPLVVSDEELGYGEDNSNLPPTDLSPLAAPQSQNLDYEVAELPTNKEMLQLESAKVGE